MSGIDFSQNQALSLAQEMDQNFKSESWILEFEREIQTARLNYDRENNDYDSRNRYPEKAALEERYQHWTGIINAFSSSQQQLVDFSSHLSQKLSRLEWALIAKLKFIHQELFLR